MRAVRMLTQQQLRREWKSIVALTLLVGIVGAIVLASIAGARRTSSSLDRFRASSLAADLEINVGEPTAAQLRAFRKVRGVAAVAELRQLALAPLRTSNLALAGAVDTRFERIVDRARVLRGRRAEPSAALEIEIGEQLATELDLDVGDRFEFASFTPEQLAAPATNQEFKPQGPKVALRVVGIVRRPLDLGSRGAAGGVVVPTPAFVRDYRDRIGSWGGSILRVRLADRDTDLRRVVDASRRIFGVAPQEALSIETEGARDAIDVLTVALWVFAGVAALAGGVTVAIILNRRIALTAVDQPALLALGLGRRLRALAAGATAVPIALVGALLAVAGATLLSPRFPMGVARRAEPDLGMVVDRTVLLGGVAATCVVVLAIAAVAASRATRRTLLGNASDAAARSSSPTGRVAVRLGLTPSATAGLRMALEPGRGRTAVPVRSALVGAVLGLLGVVAVLTFSAGLETLVTTPRLWGRAWDVHTYDSQGSPDGAGDCGPVSTRLTSEPSLDSVVAVCRLGVLLDARATTAYGFTRLSGDLDPFAVVAGRAPRRSDEVAFGASTLDALGKEIGDTARVTGASAAARYRIVGKVVFPTYGPPQPLANGAAFTGAGLARLEDPRDPNGDWLLVGRLAPGVERTSAIRRLKRVPGIESVDTATLPVEIDRLRQVDQLPTILAGFLALLAVAAVGHALVTSVRRRRRDLAILKTLGFSRGQVRATVAWQATTLAVVGLLFGIPLGLVVGRSVWGVVADGLGVSTTTTVPTVALLVLVPAALAVANLVAALPARAAARTRPAVVLRSE